MASCDIHIEVEAIFKRDLVGKHPCFNPRINSYDSWVWVRTGCGLEIFQDLNLFDVLVGYKTPSLRISKLKGIPSDLSNKVFKRMTSWKNTFYHTWYTAQELIDHDWSHYHKSDFLSNFVLSELPHYGVPSDVRVIIWFDSDG